jgi:hypothetical protein
VKMVRTGSGFIIYYFRTFKVSDHLNCETKPVADRSFCFSTPTVKMVKMSVLNDALKNICNAEKAGKRQVKPSLFRR